MITRTQWLDHIRPGAKSNLFCVFLGILLWMDFLHLSELQASGSDSFLFNFISSLLAGHLIWSRIADLVLFLLLSFLILRMNEVYTFIHVRTMLPSFFCILIGGLVLYPHYLSSGLVIAILLLSSVFSAFNMKRGYVMMHAFNIGFLLSLATLIYPFSLAYILLFVVFYYNLNVLSLRVVLATLTGAFVPLFYAFLILAYTGHVELLNEYFDPTIKLQLWNLSFSHPQILYFSLIGVLLVWAIFHVVATYRQESVVPRRMFNFFIMMMAFSLLMVLFSDSGFNNLLCSLVIFISIILGRFFSLKLSESKLCLRAFQFFIGSSVLYYVYLMS